MTILAHPEAKPWYFRQLVLEQKLSGITDYLKRVELKKTIKDLKAQLSAAKAVPPCNDDILAIARESFKKFKADAVVQLSAFLQRTRGMQNPFGQHEDMRRFLLPFVFDEKMLDAAVDLLPAQGMPGTEKQKQISKLQRDIEKKTSELEKASPPGDFEWRDGSPVRDIYEDFEKTWRSVQGGLNEPATIRGIALSHGTPEEKQVWQQLNIRSAMNPAAKFSPFVPR